MTSTDIPMGMHMYTHVHRFINHIHTHIHTTSILTLDIYKCVTKF